MTHIRRRISRSKSPIPAETESWCSPAPISTPSPCKPHLRGYIPISLAALTARPSACHASVHLSSDLYQLTARNSCCTFTNPPLPGPMLADSLSAAAWSFAAYVTTSVFSSDSNLVRTSSLAMNCKEQAQTRRMRVVNERDEVDELVLTLESSRSRLFHQAAYCDRKAGG